MSRLSHQNDQDMLPVSKINLEESGMTTWQIARNAMIFAATAAAFGAAYAPAALAEIIPLVTITVG